MQYESSISSGLKDMAKVKVFVHATDSIAQADADGRAMTLAPQTYLSWLAKNQGVFVKHYAPGCNKVQKAILSFKVTRSLTLVSIYLTVQKL